MYTLRLLEYHWIEEAAIVDGCSYVFGLWTLNDEILISVLLTSRPSNTLGIARPAR